MAAPSSAISTPRRVFFLDNVCIICSFSFVRKEVTAEGIEIITKFTNQKLKLSSERIKNIECVVGVIECNINERSEAGVCTRCYRQVEKYLKLSNEMISIKENLNVKKSQTFSSNALCIPSPKQTRTKRLLRSPLSEQPTKISTTSLSSLRQPPQLSVTKVTTTTLQPFTDIVNRCMMQKPVAPRPVPDTTDTEKENVPTKPTRRSLATAFRAVGPDSSEVPPTTEVEITLHFKTEKRSTFIAKESHKKICKFIFRGQNVERGIVDVLKTFCPEELVSGTSSLVSKECKELCKRSNANALQNRSKDGILNFSWEKLHQEFQIRAPHTLKVVSSIVTDIPQKVQGKPFYHVMNSLAIALHGRSREMTALQYLCGMVLLHGGCTHRDIERLAKIGLTVTAETLRRKMVTWEESLDVDLIKLRDGWIEGDMIKYQLVGDNWDKNIVPSFRTSQQKTLSLHLFNIIGVIDRIQPAVIDDPQIQDISELNAIDFIPSVEDQKILCEELTFIVATSIIGNIDQMTTVLGAIYPKHLNHEYSDLVGLRTQQYGLGLFDCNETKTQDVIRMLKEMTRKYVPTRDEDIVEEIFFGGDRLTDERIQSAQEAMVNNEKATDRLEGFISKIEDFHRLMNFLEAIWKLTYNTNSGKDRGTAYYYRNVLNARNVKKDVKNSYRAYKFLYYSIFDGICCALFLKEMQINSMESEIPLPPSWKQWSNDQKVEWINSIARRLVQRWFFDNDADELDLLRNIRDVLSDPDHPENYWTSNVVQDRFKCHYCDKTYVFIGSLKTHEKSVHQHVEVPITVSKTLSEERDELHDHVLLQFRLIALHKNLDTAVDMGDGKRAVRSAKYETPIYNLTNKTKYLIGSVHLTGLVSGTLPKQQSERLIANRSINVTGGKNNNIALDEYVELLNRETKNTCSGFQTKESIIAHSKEFPHLIDAVKHFDSICEIRQRKGFHKLPSYKHDVKKVVGDLLEIKALDKQLGRSLKCHSLVRHRNPYHDSYRKLASMIYRHKPTLPFRRLRNKRL